MVEGQDEAPAFALTPAQASASNTFDYSSQADVKICNKASSELSQKFDCNSKNASMFGEKLKDRAQESGWETADGDIMNIPDSEGVNRNLITECGRLTEEDIRTHALGYVTDPSRRAQNNVQLCLCLSTSLTEEGHIKVMQETEKYQINQVPIGTLFFKLLMSKAAVDTRAAASHMRENLTSLDAHVGSINSNIELFNQHVKENKQGLAARGERTDDLIINLFKGCAAVKDKDFVACASKKKDECDEGSNIAVDHLVTLALNKYTNRKRTGEWNAPTNEERQIVALKASLEEHRKENLQFSKKFPPKNNRGKGDKEKGRKKEKGKSKGKQRDQDPHAWKKVPPAEGEKETKVKEDKNYNWYKHHQAWVLHKPSECKKNPNFESNDENAEKKVSFVAQLKSILASDSDSE